MNIVFLARLAVGIVEVPWRTYPTTPVLSINVYESEKVADD